MDSAKRCTRLKKNFYIIKYIIYKKKVHSIFLKIFIKPKFLPEPKFRKEKTIFFFVLGIFVSNPSLSWRLLHEKQQEDEVDYGFGLFTFCWEECFCYFYFLFRLFLIR
jgi:hypothetical protein